VKGEFKHERATERLHGKENMVQLFKKKKNVKLERTGHATGEPAAVA